VHTTSKESEKPINQYASYSAMFNPIYSNIRYQFYCLFINELELFSSGRRNEIEYLAVDILVFVLHLNALIKQTFLNF